MGGCLPYHLLVSLLLASHISLATSDALEAHISMCQNDSYVLMAASGADVQLCCDLIESACNTSSESSLLTLGPVGGGEQKSSSNGCHVKLEIRNVSSSDAGPYVCQKDGIDKSKNNLAVVDKIAEPKFEEILVSDNFDVLVRFNIGPLNRNFITEYLVTLMDRNINAKICQTQCESVEKNSVCECRYQNNNTTTYVLGKFNKNNTFSIKAARPDFENPLQSVEIEKSFNLFHHVVPGCVNDLKWSSLGPSEGNIVFKVPDSTHRITGFMNTNLMPLQYHVVLHRTEDILEKIEVNFTKTDSKQQYVAVRFSNLNAYTNYNVTVSGIGGGGEGCRVTLDFRTDKTVPASSPDIDQFSFTRVKNSTETIVMWKALPHSAWADNSVRYNVRVTGSNGGVYSSAMNETYHYIDSQQASFPLSVKIWAVNGQGVSTNYSEIIIPENKVTDLPDTQVEFMKENMANVSVNATSLQHAEQFLVHWCLGSSAGNPCKEYPHTTEKNVSSTFQVDLDLTVNKVTEKELIEIEWCDFNEDEDPLDFRKVNATKTVNPSDSDPQVPDPFSFVRGDTPRKKRSKNLKRRNRARQKKSVSAEDGTKVFFISYKVQGVWSGMVPSSCYYDRKKSKAQIIISFEGENGKQNLRLQQQCDNSKGPEQFLIERYDVFSSTDELCRGNKKKIKSIVNPIFNFSLVEIPQGAKFVCVEGMGNDEATKTETYVKAVHNPEGSTENKVIIISVVVGTVLTVVAFVIIAKLVCACRQRKNYFQEMQKTDSETIFPNLDTNSTEGEESRQSNSTINRLSTNISSGVDSGHSSTFTWALENQSQPSRQKEVESATPSTSDESFSGSGEGSGESQDTESDNIIPSYELDSEHNATGYNTTGDNTTGDNTTGDNTTGDDAVSSENLAGPSENKDTENQQQVLKELGFSFNPKRSSTSSMSSESASEQSDGSNETNDNTSQETESSDCFSESVVGERELSHPSMQGAIDQSHSSMHGAFDQSNSSMHWAMDQSHPSMYGEIDQSPSSMHEAFDQSHPSMHGAIDQSHSSMHGAGDSDLSPFYMHGEDDLSNASMFNGGNTSRSSIQRTRDFSHFSMHLAGDTHSSVHRAGESSHSSMCRADDTSYSSMYGAGEGDLGHSPMHVDIKGNSDLSSEHIPIV
ncbi:unnamed protein product [Lymnaea stagnalis]|uniref:Uncharacterized protein n=1 Tax=Lymnaea stagnalis TaxID=6523 RepID=A0AAV2IMB2_LYMST